MVILDEVKRRLSELAPEVTDLHDALAIERSRVRLEELEQKSASPEFYDDAAASGAVFAEMPPWERPILASSHSFSSFSSL